MEDGPDHYVRIRADFCCEGVWDREGCAGCADQLPLSPDLQAALKAWADWYDRDAPDGTPDPQPDFPRAEFAAQGLALARRVKAELPDWTVIYLDQGKFEASPRDVDRTVFEHEIHG